MVITVEDSHSKYLGINLYMWIFFLVLKLVNPLRHFRSVISCCQEWKVLEDENRSDSEYDSDD